MYCRDCFQPLHFQDTHADPDPSMTFEAHDFGGRALAVVLVGGLPRSYLVA